MARRRATTSSAAPDPPQIVAADGSERPSDECHVRPARRDGSWPIASTTTTTTFRMR